MAEEIADGNGCISNFKGLVTLTLVRVTLYTIVHHSSTSTYVPNFTEIEKTFSRTVHPYVRVSTVHKYVWMDGHLRPTLLGQPRKVDLKIN